MSEESNSHIKERPTIFLVEEDDNVRPLLTTKLRQLGYRLLVTADLEDAFEWVSAEGMVHADLIVMNLVGKSPEESLRLGRRLRVHAKYDGITPLIVMAEKFPQELEGTNDNVDGNDWICYYGGSNQLEALLFRLFN